MIVNTAPTIYWSLVEASLAIVSACLPTIRPLFKGLSPESVIGSIRSLFSLHSIRSRFSPTGSKIYGNSRDHDRLDSSAALFANPGTFPEGATHLPEYEAHAESLPLEDIGESVTVPENQIRVHRGFETGANV